MQSQHALQYRPAYDPEVITIPAPVTWEWPRPLPLQPDARDLNITYLGYSLPTVKTVESLGAIKRDATTTHAQSVTHSRMSPIATAAMALSGFAAIGGVLAFGQGGIFAVAVFVAIIAIMLGVRDGKRLQ